MFIFTAKVRRGRLALGVLALILACGLFTAVAGFHSMWSVPTAGVQNSPKSLKSEADRIAYLEGLGWKVEAEPVLVEELQVPETFDSTYDDYLALQSGQGFDLTQAAGKKVTRYSYAITNYPTGDQGLLVSLILYKGKVVGGEVAVADSGEILHGLAYPE